jgi:hypothetical protein
MGPRRYRVVEIAYCGVGIRTLPSEVCDSGDEFFAETVL